MEVQRLEDPCRAYRALTCTDTLQDAEGFALGCLQGRSGFRDARFVSLGRDVEAIRLRLGSERQVGCVVWALCLVRPPFILFGMPGSASGS